jgi:hypothetical protein
VTALDKVIKNAREGTGNVGCQGGNAPLPAAIPGLPAVAAGRSGRVRPAPADDAAGTNLLGLVKHLAGLEYLNLGDCFDRPATETLPWVADGSIWQGDDMWATAG